MGIAPISLLQEHFKLIIHVQKVENRNCTVVWVQENYIGLLHMMLNSEKFETNKLLLGSNYKVSYKILQSVVILYLGRKQILHRIATKTLV